MTPITPDYYVIGKVDLDTNDLSESLDKAAYTTGNRIADTAKKAGDTVAGASDQAQGKLSAATIAMGQMLGNLIQKIASTAVDAAKAAVSVGVEYNKQIEQYTVAFTNLLGSAEAAAAAIEQIKKDAAATPFDTASLVQANQLLISAGISADDARETIMALGDAVSATGGGSDVLARMAGNLQQIKNVGKATAVDIRQFAMAGIDIYGLLADYTGQTTAEVQELEVSYDLLNAALQKASAEGGRYYNAMQSQSQTLAGRISTLKDNATQLAGALTEALFKSTGQLTEAAIGWVQTLRDALTDGGPPAMGAAAMHIIGGLVDGIIKQLPDMADAAAQTIQQLLQYLGDHQDDIIGSGIKMLDALAQGLIDNLPALIQAAGVLIGKFVVSVLDHADDIVALGGKVLQALADGILAAVGTILGAATAVIARFLHVFDDSAPDAKAVGGNIVAGIVDGIKAGIGAVVDAAKSIGKAALDAAKKILDIHSPSRVFRAEVGLQIGAGIAQGILDSAQAVTDAATSVAQDALTAAQQIAAGLGEDTGIGYVSALIGGIKSGSWEQVAATVAKMLYGRLTSAQQAYIAQWCADSIGAINSAYTKDGLAGMVQAGANVAASLADGLASKTPEIMAQVKGWMAGMHSAISDALPVLGGAAKAIGDALKLGLTGGFGSIIQSAWTLVAEVGASLAEILAELAATAVAWAIANPVAGIALGVAVAAAAALIGASIVNARKAAKGAGSGVPSPSTGGPTPSGGTGGTAALDSNTAALVDLNATMADLYGLVKRAQGLVLTSNMAVGSAVAASGTAQNAAYAAGYKQANSGSTIVQNFYQDTYRTAAEQQQAARFEADKAQLMKY